MGQFVLMKKVLQTILFAIAFIGLSCSSNNKPSEPKEEFIADIDWIQIQERGYITVSIDNNSTGYFIYRGKTMGYEYELLKRFTDEHNLELRINVTKSLEEAFNKLNRGR